LRKVLVETGVIALNTDGGRFVVLHFEEDDLDEHLRFGRVEAGDHLPICSLVSLSAMTMMLCVTGSTEMTALPTVPLLLYWPLLELLALLLRFPAAESAKPAKPAEPTAATATASAAGHGFPLRRRKAKSERRRDIF
jgi:hypothetical protein